MKRIVSTLVGVCLFLGLGAAASLASDGRSSGPDTAAADALRVQFEDQHGNPQSAPYFAVDDAYPAMAPRSALVTLHNVGAVDAAGYDIAVAVTEGDGPQLAEVLRATVVAQGSDEMLYRGPLSTLRFDGAGGLAAGASVSYVVSIGWPDGGVSDNAYQGLRLQFDLRARARDAA